MKIRQTKLLGLALLLGGLALVGAGLWLLLSPAQYAATAKIRVREKLAAMDNFYREHPNKRAPSFGGLYDPNFYQCTFETLQSQIVISNACSKLFPNRTPLNRIGGVKNIRQNLRLGSIRNTEMFTITFCSTDPAEAAQVANAVAEAYRDYRINSRRELDKKGLEVYQQLYQDEEKQLSLQPTNREQLIELHKLLGSKIEAEKLDMQTSPFRMVQIEDRAVPPQTPVGPNRTLGAVLFAAGLLSLLAGILLLKPSRQPAV